MSQFNTPVRRSGGGVDVYTALLAAAFLVLAAGVFMMAQKNTEHAGGMITLVGK
mgnify:CR=1 FL=1